jgi:hypothetical protein
MISHFLTINNIKTMFSVFSLHMNIDKKYLKQIHNKNTFCLLHSSSKNNTSTFRIKTITVHTILQTFKYITMILVLTICLSNTYIKLFIDDATIYRTYSHVTSPDSHVTHLKGDSSLNRKQIHLNGSLAEWVTRQTNNLRLLTAWVQTLSVTSHSARKLLSTGWFQEQIRKCFNKLVASNTIKLNLMCINYQK